MGHVSIFNLHVLFSSLHRGPQFPIDEAAMSCPAGRPAHGQAATIRHGVVQMCPEGRVSLVTVCDRAAMISDCACGSCQQSVEFALGGG